MISEEKKPGAQKFVSSDELVTDSEFSDKDDAASVLLTQESIAAEANV